MPSSGEYVTVKFKDSLQAIVILKYKFMSWSKITNKQIKPFKWWLHKILCEYGYLVRHKDNYATYHHNLNMLCKTGFNLYGEKI